MMGAAFFQWSISGPSIRVPIDPAVLTGGAVHGQISIGCEIVPEDEPPHLLVLALNGRADLPFGRKPPTQFRIASGTLFMPHSEVGLV